MKTVVRVIRLLEIVLLIGYTSCQEGFSEQDILRLQQLSANDGQYETITSYSTNVVQRDPSKNEHSVSSVSVQYHLTDEPEKLEDYHRINHGRSDSRRKIFHIKNPFQRNLDQNADREPEAFSSQDSDSGASNQYASMQYSLPPEEFLQQMRAESQYLQQFSTPSPQPSYTVTPQPQYQFNNNNQGYEGTQASNQMDNKMPQAQAYQGNPSNYQYLTQQNSYLSEGGQSTPINQSPPYVSTAIPNGQYVATPSNAQTYVSSSSPLYMSSQSSVPQYVSSPVTMYQTGTSDYNNRASTISNNINYDVNDPSKKMHIDHYDNGANGIRYPNGQSYQNEVSSTTLAPPTPSSTPYPDSMRDVWQNAMNAGVNSLSKSLQEVSLYSQYQNNDNQQQQIRQDSNADNINSETHRIGNVAAANNMYMNYVQPDYQLYNNIKSRIRDLEQETGQSEMYSHGDYGWKLAGKKSLIDSYVPTSYSPYSRQHLMALHSDNQIAQGNYQSEQQKQSPSYAYNRISPDTISQSSKSSEQEAQEFAKAAAKAQENMKQQQAGRINENYYLNSYAPSYGTSGLSNGNAQSNVVSTFYGNTDKHKTRYLTENSNANSYIYGNNPTDLITAAAPYLYANSRDSDSKTKQPFDHAKALKNIVPIDVSNVVSNNEAALKAMSSLDNNNRYLTSYPKDQMEQTLKQAYRPLADSFYKDKNTGYAYNIKGKTEDNLHEGVKQLEQNIAFYNKHNPQDSAYNQVYSDSKRYADSLPQQVSYVSTSGYSDIQPPNNIQQAIQRPVQQQQSDIASIFKLNDIPYRYTQGLTSDSLKLHNNNFDHASIPQPIPTRINQNVGSHQMDVTNSLLNKLLLSKQAALNYNRPSELDSQTAGPLSTIHGFRVANPFNVDLKLVAEMLKGKPTVDETHLASLREQFNKPMPLKLDMSALQHLLIKNDNYGNLAPLSDGLSAIGNIYGDPYGAGRYPYQGQVKYSRSQEEEESILPIAESSNTHPIGAVMEQDDSPNVREADSGTELTADEDLISHNNYEDRPKSLFNTRDHRLSNGPRHPNALPPGRFPHSRKYHKHDVDEPYPLLKPPPPHSSRSRMYNKERRGRRRRVSRPKITRMLKTEPLFESESSPVHTEVETPIPLLLKPPAPNAQEKSDVVEEKKSS